MKRVSFESLSKKHFFDKLQGGAEAAPQTVEKPIQAKVLEGGKASQSLRPQAQKIGIIFHRDICVGKNSPQAAGVEFYRKRQNHARS